ncbi:hypothetical protein [Ruminococcus albus]|uniref:Uncharacterized protein n=1 Tax=Ruminococcus albus TaxID=1264 RepID=A0A1H7Q7K9_RUMAL|nr:hypothetical protein [Ruminococcus albus]SEL43973.1 hypothetical protein SAMN05216469_1317 [Ruminococcus albus]
MTKNDWIKLKVLFPYVSTECNISNQEQIENVVCKTAYNDMAPRTLPDISKVKDENGNLLKDVMLKYVTDRFIKYFDESAPKDKHIFDKWHKDTCNEMIKVFEKSSVNFTYGKAQKLINIAFKNFLLFNGAKEEYFTYCHTPIDNNVLYWCKKVAGIKRINCAWSNMNEELYIELQEKISEYLKSDKNTKYLYEDGRPISNLVVDFYAWIEGGNTEKLIIEWGNISTKVKFYIDNEKIINTVLENLQ